MDSVMGGSWRRVQALNAVDVCCVMDPLTLKLPQPEIAVIETDLKQ